MMTTPSRPWILRAIAAGFAAALVGTAIGAFVYLGLPGAMRLDWSIMPWVLLGFSGLSGVLGGLGLGTGMIVATRRRISAPRLVLGSALGGAVGCLLPGVVGIAGFGSLDAPYAGTTNIVSCLIVGSAVFVAIWSPALDESTRRGPWFHRLGLATIASVVTCGAAGIAGWTLATMLGAIPTLQVLQAWADAHGLVSMSLIAGLLLGLGVGAMMGLATWIGTRLMRISGSR